MILHPLFGTKTILINDGSWSCPELRWNGQRHICGAWGFYTFISMGDSGQCLRGFWGNRWMMTPLRNRVGVTRAMLYNGDPRGL
jgi:hypothetical protein